MELGCEQERWCFSYSSSPTHSAPAPAPSLFLHHTRDTPATGPLHLGFPLPRLLFHQISTGRISSPPSNPCSHITVSVRASLTLYSKLYPPLRPHQSFLPLSPASFFCVVLMTFEDTV